MAEKQRVIYRARNAVQAHLLKNLLAEEGIRAEVTNTVLEGGAGVDILGWPTLARVVVDESVADQARQIALEFDREDATPAAQGVLNAPEPPPETQSPWPQCPRCGAPRLAVCPACGTSSVRFPPADLPPADLPPADGPPAESSQQEEAVPNGLLICTTCDEPFAPRYLPQCEWCGHPFEPRGSAAEASVAEPPEEMTPRVWGVVLAILALVAVVVGYLAFVF